MFENLPNSEFGYAATIDHPRTVAFGFRLIAKPFLRCLVIFRRSRSYPVVRCPIKASLALNMIENLFMNEFGHVATLDHH